MHYPDLILTLTAGLTAALMFGYVTHKIGLSPIVGYLLAGLVVGPYTPGVQANQAIAEELAEVGVILLMFGVGLNFHVDDLLAVWKTVVPGWLTASITATILGVLIAFTWGWHWSAGMILGLAMSVASTVVLMRVLSDQNELHTPPGRLAIGWSVIEDLFTVLILVVLPVVFKDGVPGGDGDNPGLIWRILFVVLVAAVKVTVLALFMMLAGRRLIPWLLERIAATRSRELFTLGVLVLPLGIASGSAFLFGVSMALGAFLAGMTVGRSDFSVRASTDALPMRDAFAVLFFVSVGMLFDPRVLLEHPMLVLAATVIVLVAKPAGMFAAMAAVGQPLPVALKTSSALAQIGEFSFVLAELGRELGILDATATNVLVAASIISITLHPIRYRTTRMIAKWLARPFATPTADEADAAAEHPPRELHRTIVVGYGPVGRTLTRLLRGASIDVCVIELNLATVRSLQADRIPAVYGDSSQRETLLAAGIATADNLVLSSGDGSNSESTIRVARDLNPRINILSRTSYVRDVRHLQRAGATHVFSGEGEVALALIEAVLRPLGATPEQIDRERDRFRTEAETGRILP